MSNATLFVRFKNENVAQDKGFKPEHSYPVYQVRDVEEGDDLVTELLLANNDGELSWLPMGEFKRSKPAAPSHGGRPDRHPRRDNRNDSRNDSRNNDDRGNRRHDGPNYSGGGGGGGSGRGAILGDRGFDD